MMQQSAQGQDGKPSLKNLLQIQQPLFQPYSKQSLTLLHAVLACLTKACIWKDMEMDRLSLRATVVSSMISLP